MPVVASSLLAVAILSTGLLAPASYADTATNYYVDPVNGSDANAGTSVTTAFKTIGAAQSAVRSVNASMAADIDVNLLGGTYTVPSTVTFTPADSGANGHVIHWQAYQGQTPVITSAQTITGWTQNTDGTYSAPIGSLNFHQLYVNGVRASVARYPEAGQNFVLRSVDNTNKLLGVAASQVKQWANFTNVEMVLQQYWGESYLPLKSYTVSGGTANLSINDAMAGILFQRPNPVTEAGEPFYFENAKEFLTEPGEYYVDTSTQTLTYKARAGEDPTVTSGAAATTVTAPTLQTLFDFEGTGVSTPVQGLAFSGITFADTTWTLPLTTGEMNAQGGQYNKSADATYQYVYRPPAGIHANYASNLTFSGDTFTRMGSAAIDFDHGVSSSLIIGNIVSDIAGNGIMIGKFSDPDVPNDTPYNPSDPGEIVNNVTVQDNLVTNTGEDYPGTAGINAGYVSYTNIVHNDVSNSPWVGISLGWGWTYDANALQNNQITDNAVSNVMNALSDGGGIYHLSNDRSTTISGNYVHEVTRGAGSLNSAATGIYLDQGSANMTVTGNVISNVDTFMVLHNNGPSVTNTNNTTSGSTVITAAGLEPSYASLKQAVNLAYGKTATASSQYSGAFAAGNANDGASSTGWLSAGADTAAWWQVDLGAAHQLGQFTITTRQDLDQAMTRNNIEVRASNDPTFATYNVVGRVDSRTIPDAGSYTRSIDPTQAYRYIRVAKTDGQSFYLAEFAVQQGIGETLTQTPLTVSPSSYYTLTNVNSGKVLDVNGASTANGGTVDQWTNVTGATNEQWSIQNVSGDLYKILNRNSGKALEVNNRSHLNGGTVDQWTYTGDNHQLWKFTPDVNSGWVITNLESGRVLDVYGASLSNGGKVDQWSPLSASNEAWTLTPVP
ncbi:RICIN domain-containing protein [Microbacterium sp. ASV49]|uniref:RICIN domain-containing protein n=1 Tax=Microbacterium candidum TaxID=3041922 RepID=A0ABT7MTK8_9MICO|nr:RICIN domain-containing protein [Microbacterium sp. ASV49]MDL9977784.1 RICIN domain-containing protein [Microbacterium sp. ASV49]